MSDAVFEQQPFRDVVFAENPENRCPVVLLLDNSVSMRGQPIEELNKGLQLSRDELFADSLAAKRMKVVIISFGPIKTQCDFIGIEHFNPPVLQVEGDAPMGGAIEQGLELLRQRKDTYKANGSLAIRPASLSGGISLVPLEEVRRGRRS